MTTRIEQEVQLLVEGNDERNFFTALVGHLHLKSVQIQVLNGKDRLTESLETLAGTTGFRGVRSIGIVRDADHSADTSFQSVQTSLRNANQIIGTWFGVEFPVPHRPEERAGEGLSLRVLILPGGRANGMLETLLCRTFDGTHVDDCIGRFFECAQQAGISIARRDKARAQAYLATRLYPHVSVGVAAQKGYWDFDHDAFEGVRQFLRSLAADRPIAQS